MKYIDKVYIAGPITGKPGGNRKAFADAETQLKLMGYNPVNPHKLNHRDNVDDNWYIYMRVSIAAMLQCDAIVLLNGWEESDGAQTEIKLATSLDMPWAFMNDAHLEFYNREA